MTKSLHFLAMSLFLTAIMPLSAPQKCLAQAAAKETKEKAAVTLPKTVIAKTFGYPNGITQMPDGTLLVGSVTSSEILKIAPGSTPKTVFKGAKNVFAGTALRFDPLTNLLWVASPDFLSEEDKRRPHRIAVLDIMRGKVVWSTPMPDKGFGNDFTLDGRGGVYVTDSVNARVLHIAAPGAPHTIAARSPLFAQGRIGPAGIAKLPDGDLVIGLFSAGKLFRISPNASGKAAKISPITLARPIENPDGLALHPDGRLLVIDAAVQSGNGKLLAIDLESDRPLRAEILMDHLDTPLNLTVTKDKIFVSEGRIRHIMFPKGDVPEPDKYYVVNYPVPKAETSARPAIALPDRWYPESIARTRDGRLFTSSATQGAIAVTDAPSGQTSIFVKAGTNGLMSVQGLLADETNQRLYACTANLGVHKTPTKESALLKSALVAFSLKTGEPKGRWPLDKNGLCNDITQLQDHTLLITDTNNGRLLSFDPSKGKLQEWLRHPQLDRGKFKANGLVYSPSDRAVFVTLFSEGKLLRIDLANDGSPQDVAKVDLPRLLKGADAIRLAAPGRLVIFENGLTTNGGGQITSVIVEKHRGRLAPIHHSEDQPTSGVIFQGEIWYPTSHFSHLFGKETKADPGLFAIKRVLLPSGFAKAD